jgi:hypothetical protein
VAKRGQTEDEAAAESLLGWFERKLDVRSPRDQMRDRREGRG